MTGKMNEMDVVERARRVFDIEIDALVKTKESLDDTFKQIFEAISCCDGKVIVMGMGKPGHIASKLAATFSSLGIPSFCIHPAEAMHGDLGMISVTDIVLILSNSGESDEIIRILPNIRMIGAKIVAITGNEESSLAKMADLVQVLPKFKEACSLGLAPTASTTVELCYGDALAVVTSEMNGFTESDFGKYHPAGSLGKKLVLKVSDIMVMDEEVPKVYLGTSLMHTIDEMSKKTLGMVSVVDHENVLQGIITDGDLRRALEKKIDIYTAKAEDVMTLNPYYTRENVLVVDALVLIRNTSINALPVVNKENRLIGALDWQMIIKAGIVV